MTDGYEVAVFRAMGELDRRLRDAGVDATVDFDGGELIVVELSVDEALRLNELLRGLGS